MDVSELSHEERVAFFTNVYHALTIHASLELGEPGSAMSLRALMHAGAFASRGCARRPPCANEFVADAHGIGVCVFLSGPGPFQQRTTLAACCFL